MKDFADNDTIAAIATPPGEGGIGIVRISGENAGFVADKFFKPVKKGFSVIDFKTHQAVYGKVIDDVGNVIDEALCIAANKNVMGARVRIVLDVENYRSRREETLCQLAQKLAARARKYRNKVVLEPMNRHERKIIHMALQDYADIITYSEGVEPHRKIVVDIKHNKNEDLLIK